VSEVLLIILFEIDLTSVRPIPWPNSAISRATSFKAAISGPLSEETVLYSRISIKKLKS
jgi:hypothetical protein